METVLAMSFLEFCSVLSKLEQSLNSGVVCCHPEISIVLLGSFGHDGYKFVNHKLHKQLGVTFHEKKYGST